MSCICMQYLCCGVKGEVIFVLGGSTIVGGLKGEDREQAGRSGGGTALY